MRDKELREYLRNLTKEERDEFMNIMKQSHEDEKAVHVKKQTFKAYRDTNVKKNPQGSKK